MVTTDASGAGWGALCKAELSGLNVLELRAVWCALQSFAHLLKEESVLLRVYNTTAGPYVLRQGGTWSFIRLQEVEPIVSWAQRYLANISAVFFPGVQNVQVDFLLRTQTTSGPFMSRCSCESCPWESIPRGLRLLPLATSRSRSITLGAVAAKPLD